LAFILTQYFLPVIAESASEVFATPRSTAPFALFVAKGNLSAPSVSDVILLALILGISAATNVLNEGTPLEPFGAANTVFLV
jgi:hypothetical protein